MPIVVRLNNILRERKTNIKSFAKRIKTKEYNLSLLSMEKKTIIKFSLLNKICKELKCQPGDIFWFCNKKKQDPNSLKEIA